MKTLLTAILLVLAVTSYSQNFVGKSLRDVKLSMDRKGYIIEEGYKDGYYYISASDMDEYKFYMFTENNVCFMYITSSLGYTYDIIEAVLLKQGYWATSNSQFTDGEYEATVVYSNDSGRWYIRITYR